MGESAFLRRIIDLAVGVQHCSERGVAAIHGSRRRCTDDLPSIGLTADRLTKRGLCLHDIPPSIIERDLLAADRLIGIEEAQPFWRCRGVAVAQTNLKIGNDLLEGGSVTRIERPPMIML